MKHFFPLTMLSAMSAFGASFVFETLPAGGFHSGAPGDLLGYGYVLENPDPTRYLLTTNFTAGSFSHASVTSVFDFPVLAPGQTISLTFDPNTLAGLFAVLLDAGAPIGFVNSGSFVVSGDFYDGDPSNGGTFAEAAGDQVAGYEVTVTSAIPEPSLAGLTGLLVTTGLLLRSRVRARGNLFQGMRSPGGRGFPAHRRGNRDERIAASDGGFWITGTGKKEGKGGTKFPLFTLRSLPPDSQRQTRGRAGSHVVEEPSTPSFNKGGNHMHENPISNDQRPPFWLRQAVRPRKAKSRSWT